MTVSDSRAPVWVAVPVTLEGRYQLRLSFRDVEAVEAYLASHLKVWSLLEAAYPSLIECFGPVDIVLEVRCETLVAWIQSTDSVDEGLRKLERFDDMWVLDHIELLGDDLSFNVETV